MKKAYISLWLLLVVGLIVILTVAFSDDIMLGSYTIKKAPYKEALLTDKLAEAREKAQLDSILAVRRDSMENAKALAQVDSVPQSILLIGDSMTFLLSLRFAQYAKANGHTIHTVNWDSSNTVRWGDTNYLADYIKQFDATYVLVCLGANELYSKNPQKHQKHLNSILEQIGDLPYIWIGPPNWKGESEFNDYLEGQLRPGSFFRSSGIQLSRKKDGIHPTKEASAIWADSIARWMPNSAHPILFNTPHDSIGEVSSNLIYKGAREK